jgi:hypothetical protein
MNLKAAAVLAVAAASACSARAVSPGDFASAHGKDAHAVVVAVQEVESDAAIMAVSREAGPSTRASFYGIIDHAKSAFDTAGHNLLLVGKPAGLEQSDDEMWAATDELSSAMKALRAFIDDGNPSELADYKKHWNQGRAWWNQAVTAIWQAANTPAPTVANPPEHRPLKSISLQRKEIHVDTHVIDWGA